MPILADLGCLQGVTDPFLARMGPLLAQATVITDAHWENNEPDTHFVGTVWAFCGLCVLVFCRR